MWEAREMPDRIPVILDTDIGSDIDDAFALAYLLRQPRCELLGVTTVSGAVEQRAALAQVLCRAAGREDVPVHCGARTPLLYGPGQPEAPQYQAIREMEHRLDWPEATALAFLRRTVRARPGEVVLLSIGPLTNVALLLALDPEAGGLLRAWVSMAGQFANPEGESEWNSRCDPLATAIAFRSAVPRHVHVGLDVTRSCRLPAEAVRARLKGTLLELVSRMAEVWLQKREEIVFHDPLAAALLFRPDLCESRRGRVHVDEASGAMRFDAGAPGWDEVAVSVDATAFFDEYFSVFKV
jgi:purine nucleosidase